MRLLRGATNTFHNHSPTQDELTQAGLSIACAVHSADKLGFRTDIQPALDEALFAAEAAARVH